MKLFYCVILLLLIVQARAQRNPDIKFIEHLVNKGDYREALYLMDRTEIGGTVRQQDSLNYLKGWSLYSLKDLSPSTRSLLMVTQTSPFYLKSRFFAAYNQIYLSDFNQTTNILNNIKTQSPVTKPLSSFELAGIDLLNQHYNRAEKELYAIDSTLSVLYEPLIKMKLITNELKNHKGKSPLLTGIFSAIVPGSGKIYAGKKGQGISSFIATVGLGLITWENYRKVGPANIKTIIFGTAFTANYIAGIYGSVKSVKIVENEYQTAIHNQILFHLHIPLRNFFE